MQLNGVSVNGKRRKIGRTYSPVVADRTLEAIVFGIAVLVDGMRDQGEHQEKFNLSHLPAGMYYYVLQSGGQRSMRRFVIVR